MSYQFWKQTNFPESRRCPLRSAGLLPFLVSVTRVGWLVGWLVFMFRATAVLQLSKPSRVVQSRLGHQRAVFGDRAPWSFYSHRGVAQRTLSLSAMTRLKTRKKNELFTGQEGLRVDSCEVGDSDTERERAREVSRWRCVVGAREHRASVIRPCTPKTRQELDAPTRPRRGETHSRRRAARAGVPFPPTRDFQRGLSVRKAFSWAAVAQQLSSCPHELRLDQRFP